MADGATQDGPARDLVALCHDLRQYVTAGQLLAELPANNGIDEDTRRRFVMIKQAFDHASALLEQALEGGPNDGAVEFRALVEDCVQVARVRHPVELVVLEDSGTIYCDTLLLHRAVDNMLDNAIRAVGDAGRIIVRIGVDDDASFVEVIDEGPGFGLIPSVSGRGMSMVGEAVDACHGRITIDSGPGPGTSVRITLPRDGGRPLSSSAEVN